MTILGAYLGSSSLDAETAVDPYTGLYKIAALVDGSFTETIDDAPVTNTYVDGLPGRITVFYNTNGALRFNGWVYDEIEKVRVPLRGRVNPNTGRLFFTTQSLTDAGILTLNARILMRNNAVVGFTGTGETEFDEVEQQSYDIEVLGYKIKDLAQ